MVKKHIKKIQYMLKNTIFAPRKTKIQLKNKLKKEL